MILLSPTVVVVVVVHFWPHFWGTGYNCGGGKLAIIEEKCFDGGLHRTQLFVATFSIKCSTELWFEKAFCVFDFLCFSFVISLFYCFCVIIIYDF